MSDYPKAFGLALKQMRAKVAISQEDLAFRSQLDRTYISGLERGRRNPTLTSIVRIAGALGVQPHVLLAEMQEQLARTEKR